MRSIGLFAALLVLVAPPPLWLVTVPLAVLFCPYFGGPDSRSLYELLRGRA
jgi:hypothetical protein